MYYSSDPWKCLLLGSADLLSIVDCGKIFKKHYCPFSINWGHITMLAEDRGSDGNVFAYGIECSVSNAYVLDKFTKPIERAHSGRSKRDYFAFRYELAKDFLVVLDLASFLGVHAVMSTLLIGSIELDDGSLTSGCGHE